MNEHALRVLEYGPFLNLLSHYARSTTGREALQALRPRPRPEDVAAMRRLYAEAMELRRSGVSLPAADVDPPDEALARAAREKAVLEPGDFLAVRRMLALISEVRRFLVSAMTRSAPALRELGEELDGLPELARQIDRIIQAEPADAGDSQTPAKSRPAPAATVREGASPRLRRLRRQIATLERQLQNRLEALLNDHALDGVFQDRFITLRHDRYVLPVRRDALPAIRGIIHDQSHSGSTLFVEPEELVEPGNRLELLRLAERDEIRRILSALTTELRSHLPAIHRNRDLLTRYDMAWAVSAWAVEFNAHMPEVGDPLRLVAARHPLLERRMAQAGRSADLVPLDLDLPAGCTVTVITGSNTGGKTVALKTIGLLTLLAQSGLPIPARPGSRLRFFSDVQADIGDEQSIEQSLSTFGAHLEHIVAALTAAREGEVLVLLDELGAGTDPVEGGALACALLEAFSLTRGLTFATTHLGAVKRFVHGHPAMENASMLFDVETLRPQYRMLMGRAGGSYALAVAERCGIPPEIVAAARRLMDADDVRLEAMLTSLDGHQVRLEQERRDLNQALADAREACRRARCEEERLHRERDEARRERRRLLQEAREQAARLVEQTRLEVEAMLQRLRADPRRESARGLLKALDHKVEQAASGGAEASSETRACRPGDLKPGDRVRVPLLQEDGEVLSVSPDGRRVRLKAGSLYLESQVSDLQPAPPGSVDAAAPAPAPSSKRPPAAARELNLVGARTDEAVSRLEAFLDAALRAGLDEVRVIHGFGTGALRRAVHACLDRWPVRGYRLGEDDRDPGGAGVTVVTL